MVPPLTNARRLVLAAVALASAASAAPASAGIWTEIPSATTQSITAIEYQSATRFWFTTSSGAVYTRQPNGTFSRTRAPGGVPLNDIEFQAGGRIGLAVGAAGLVLRSTDAGATWTTVTFITASRAEGTQFPQCNVTQPLGDANAVRFAGNGRAWILAGGSQIVRSQPANASEVGALGTWTDANRDTKGTADPDDDTCRIQLEYSTGFADAFFLPDNPDVGFIIAGYNSQPFYTTNNLAGIAARKPATAGNSGGLARVLAADPEDPNRLWSVLPEPYGRSTTGRTRDGFQTSEPWIIGNESVRQFPQTGPADVDYAGGTVLSAAGDGTILNSIDGEKFFYNLADGALQTQHWNAVGLASGSDGAVGGDDGKLVITTQANTIPTPAAPPPPPPPGPPAPPTPSPQTPDARPLPSFTLSGRGNGATARVSKSRVKVAVKGRVKLPPGVDAATACSGTVKMTVKKGKKVVGTSNVKLTRACEFSKSVNVARRRVGSSRRLNVEMRFPGNAELKPVTQKLSVRIRR
jgi:hypothetical protein